MNLGFGDISVLHAFLAWLNSLLYKFRDHVFELSFGDFYVKMLRSGGISSNERKGDVGLSKSVQFTLGFLSSLTQALHGQVIAGQVDSRLFLKSFKKILQ
mmetsp:Transcript_3325/g.7052  ORF Transcript_3325/g.7052 Transcript_3325/m.7052 type:complete len:100 (-) Transcript_3325:969-1268(-)